MNKPKSVRKCAELHTRRIFDAIARLTPCTHKEHPRCFSFVRDSRKESLDHSAFPLGVDLRALCTADEAAVVETFFARVSNEAEAPWMLFVRAGRQAGDRVEDAARVQLGAFAHGFRFIHVEDPYT